MVRNLDSFKRPHFMASKIASLSKMDTGIRIINLAQCCNKKIWRLFTNKFRCPKIRLIATLGSFGAGDHCIRYASCGYSVIF